MNCDQIGPLLQEAAAGANVTPALEQHLGVCARCRERLNLERQLFAAIDNGVATLASGDPPAYLAAAIRAKLSEAAGPGRSWKTLAIAAALAFAAVLLLLIPARHGQSSGPLGNLPVAGNLPPAAKPSAIEPAAPARSLVTRKALERLVGNAALVPVGQQKAVAQLLVGLRSGEIPTSAVNSGALSGDLEIPLLASAEIEIKPLESDSATVEDTQE
jgi:hypothetical protein